MRDQKMMGPLGMYGIANSQVQSPGYAALLDPMTGEPMEGGGGGGGGFSFGFGGQRGPNQMEQTIAAHNYPGGFKVATDQYAARYSDQLDAAALLEMKDKYRDGPAVGGTWDEFASNRKANIDNYYKTGELWGPNGSTGRTESSPVATSKVITPYTHVQKKSNAPLSGRADRDRSGLASRVVNYGSGGSSSGRGSRGSRTKPSSSRIGGRYGL